MKYPSQYSQLRTVYRDLEQRRADIFYDIKRSEKRTQELRMELNDIDYVLDQYQAEIRRRENGEDE